MSKDSNSIYTSRVKKLRESQQLTQEKFAEEIDISSQTVSLMERKQKGLNLHTAITIKQKYDVSLDWLYELSDDTKDSASNILVALKDIFDINLAEKRIKINENLAIFLEEISKAYKIKQDTNMPDEPFNLWIEEIKRRYNAKSKGNNNNDVYYYLQTANEHFKEEPDKILG